jgi:hypothetical protein
MAPFFYHFHDKWPNTIRFKMSGRNCASWMQRYCPSTEITRVFKFKNWNKDGIRCGLMNIKSWYKEQLQYDNEFSLLKLFTKPEIGKLNLSSKCFQIGNHAPFDWKLEEYLINAWRWKIRLQTTTLNRTVIARNRGHLNPETSLTSMSLITPFDPRNLLF